MVGSDALLYAAVGLGAAEATGVTNLTGIGSGSDSGGSEGSGFQGLPPGLLNAARGTAGDVTGLRNAVRDLQATTAAAQQTGTTVIESTEPVVERVREVVTVPSQSGGGDGGGSGGSGSSGGSARKPWPYTSDSPGGSDYTMTESTNPWVRDAGATGQAAGNWAGTAGSTVNKWVSDGMNATRENPYAATGTLIGGIAGSVVPGAGTAAGAAAGGAAGSAVEIGVDTITGGTPLGVQSPIQLIGGSDQTDRNTDGSSSKPSTNGSDNPDRGERQRTVTVPSASADQERDRDLSTSKSTATGIYGGSQYGFGGAD